MAVIPAAEWIDRARVAFQSVERGRINGDTQTEVTRLLVADVAPPSDSMDGYQEWTRMTAIYPGAGTGSGAAVLYTALGLCDEVAEVAKKLILAIHEKGLTPPEPISPDTELVLKRLVKFDGATGSVKNTILEALGRVANVGAQVSVLKKAICGDYDGDRGEEFQELEVSDADREVMAKIKAYAGKDKAKSEIGDVSWYHARHADENGFRASEVTEANIEKLESRKARNVIKGSGDTGDTR